MEKGRERKDEMKRKINSYVKERRKKREIFGKEGELQLHLLPNLFLQNAKCECDQTHVPCFSQRLLSPFSHPPMVLSPQASHLSVSLWCSGTASKACGRSAKPGPGFGAWLLLVEQDPGPLRAEGWQRRVEGEGGRAEREESRGSKQYSSGSPSKSSNPSGETGFLCGERGRVWREWEKEGKDVGDKRQGGKVLKEKGKK